MTRQELEAQIDAEKKARADACMTELQEILKQHQCELLAVPSLVPESGAWKLVAVVQLVAR